jgi:hypothetical protein
MRPGTRKTHSIHADGVDQLVEERTNDLMMEEMEEVVKEAEIPRIPLGHIKFPSIERNPKPVPYTIVMDSSSSTIICLIGWFEQVDKGKLNGEKYVKKFVEDASNSFFGDKLKPRVIVSFVDSFPPSSCWWSSCSLWFWNQVILSVTGAAKNYNLPPFQNRVSFEH